MTVKAQKETLRYEADTHQLLDLFANSLYSNKEIFVRELIANASDAIDKLRFEGLKDEALYEGVTEMAIHVTLDKEKSTLTFKDTGIGMTREEIVERLGTIAHSGTKEFLKNLSGDEVSDAKLIGQFGVGFYSSFVVADRVSVMTRRAGMQPDQGVHWESDGKGEFSVENTELPERGTTITLHLKKEHAEFLEAIRIRTVINKYSDHIAVPIFMLGEAEEDKEPAYEQVNQAKALWTMPKSEITDEQYAELYKHVSHDFDDPLAWAHNKVEGKLDYTSLLYVPKHAPFDLYHRDVSRGLKLYVQRVFIMDDAENFLPMYLRFVKGVVDSNDLPLNVSREMLQNDVIIDTIRSGCTRRILDMLTDMVDNAPDKYATFWSEFGSVLKEGPAEDMGNRDKIAKLFRFASTHTDEENASVSFADYISRMKTDQAHIYYVTADSFSAAKNSPHLEIFRKKGIEVLLMCDQVDEWMVAHLPEIDGKTLQSVAKGSLDLDDDKEDEAVKKEQEDDFEGVLKQVKTVLEDKIKDVRLTHRLTDSPACLVSDDNDLGIHMQRILEKAGQSIPGAKPIFELNPEHRLIAQLKAEQDDDRFSQWCHLLFEQALLTEGMPLPDPAGFVRRLNRMLEGVS